MNEKVWTIIINGIEQEVVTFNTFDSAIALLRKWQDDGRVQPTDKISLKLVETTVINLN